MRLDLILATGVERCRRLLMAVIIYSFQVYRNEGVRCTFFAKS